MNDTSPSLSDRLKAANPRGTNSVWQFNRLSRRWLQGRVMPNLVQVRFLIWERRKEEVDSSEFPSCAERNIYVVALMMSPLLWREKTKAIHRYSRCSSVGALTIRPEVSSSHTHTDTSFIWTESSGYESSHTGPHFKDGPLVSKTSLLGVHNMQPTTIESI